MTKYDHYDAKCELPAHTPGTAKGEEVISKQGKEKGRQHDEPQRTARDSTSVDPKGRMPIDPRMPHLPPP